MGIWGETAKTIETKWLESKMQPFVGDSNVSFRLLNLADLKKVGLIVLFLRAPITSAARAFRSTEKEFAKPQADIQQ